MGIVGIGVKLMTSTRFVCFLLILFFPQICLSEVFPDFKFKTQKHNVLVKRLVGNLDHPWGLAFLPNDLFLVSERSGKLKLIMPDLSQKLVHGLPDVWDHGQGGLLDVVTDPNFSQNQIIYFSFSEPSSDKRRAGTAVASAKLILEKKPVLKNMRVIFTQNIKSSSSVHFGSRIVISPNRKLFITIGDRGDGDRAQNPFDHAGSVLRINTDGSSPSSNPFFGSKKALPEIWSIGHRNPQGAIWNIVTESLWTLSHGAQGGDEINQPLAGKNYGWPVISYGRHYWGAKIGVGTHKSGLQQPVYYWDPSIAPSGFAIYSGDVFSKWKGNLLVGALKHELISRLELKNGKIVSEERLFPNRFGRIRDIRVGSKGHIYFLTDETDGGLYKISSLD